jgi:hypothetical protein
MDNETNKQTPGDPQVAGGEPHDTTDVVIDPAEIRRRYASQIEQKLVKLQHGWEAENDPQAVVYAFWLTEQLEMPRPEWLAKIAAQWPSETIAVWIDRLHPQIDNSDIGIHKGRPSDRKRAIALAVEHLEEELRADENDPIRRVTQSKAALARHLKNSHEVRDELATVLNWLTEVWGIYHPERSRSRRNNSTN